MSDITIAIQTALDIAGKLKTLSEKTKDADLRILIAELTSELADAKLNAANLKIELAQERSLNQELYEKLNTKLSGSPKIADGVYTFAGEEGKFCTACYDTKKQKVLVTELTGHFRTFGKWRCPACTAKFG